MKSEVKDIVYEVGVRTAPATGLAFWASLDWTAILYGILLILQILYLLRKWWREDSDWGKRLKGCFRKKNEPNSQEKTD